MSLFKKKKKETQNLPPLESPSNDLLKDDLSKKVNLDIYSKKKNIYTTPGVDEVSYQKENVKKEFLIRPTSYICPICNSFLYNVKLDGSHYYCPRCQVHHHKSKLIDDAT